MYILKSMFPLKLAKEIDRSADFADFLLLKAADSFGVDSPRPLQ